MRRRNYDEIFQTILYSHFIPFRITAGTGVYPWCHWVRRGVYTQYRFCPQCTEPVQSVSGSVTGPPRHTKHVHAPFEANLKWSVYLTCTLKKNKKLIKHWIHPCTVRICKPHTESLQLRFIRGPLQLWGNSANHHIFCSAVQIWQTMRQPSGASPGRHLKQCLCFAFTPPHRPFQLLHLIHRPKKEQEVLVCQMPSDISSSENTTISPTPTWRLRIYGEG